MTTPSKMYPPDYYKKRDGEIALLKELLEQKITRKMISPKMISIYEQSFVPTSVIENKLKELTS